MKKLYSSLLITLFLLIVPQKLFPQQFTEESGISLTGTGQGSLAWGDYNNDGYLDIILSGDTDSGPTTSIYKNNGDNTFALQPAISLTGVFIGSVAWGDYDNDGDLDILLTGTTTGNTIDAISKIYRNDGGVFTDIAAGLTGVYLSSVAWGDYDNDGDLDILMTGMSVTGERISRIYNNTNGIFTEQTGTDFTSLCYGQSLWGDFDNDGDLDVLLTGQTATFSRVAKIYRNNGNGSFTELTNVLLANVSYGSVALADYNNDGFPDILLSGEDAEFVPVAKLYKNNGNSTFSEQTAITLDGIKKGAVAWGDYDNDGDIDLFLTGDHNNTPLSKIYTNNNGSFAELTGLALTAVYESAAGLCDYDKDGDLDLLLAGFDAQGNITSKIYRNNNSTPNTKPVSPSGLEYEIDKSTADFRWKRVSGDETSKPSISYNIRVGLSPSTSELLPTHSDVTGFRKIVSIGNAQLDTTFKIKNLRWNTDYYASVQAIDNTFAGGDFSAPVSLKITPLQPTSLTGSNLTKTSLLLKWNRGNGDKCILFAREGAAGPSSPVNNTTYFANPVFGDGSPIGTTGWFCIYKGEADSVIISGLATEKDYTIHAIEFQGSIGSETYSTEINPANDNIGVFSSGIFTVLSGISMTGVGASSVSWGDYDNDGYLDILLTGQKIGGEGISQVYRNNGNNTFTEQTGISPTGVYYGSSAWGDYNNDDLLDILLTGNNGVPGSITKIYKNNGDNTFSEQTDISLTGVYYSSVGWSDYDKDGDLDILLTGMNHGVGPISKIYRNDGGNVFTEQTGIQLTGVNKSSVAWGDYDNNGDPDILLTGLDSNGKNVAKLYRNNGNNTFSEQNIGLTGVSFSSVTWGDYDNDGFLDILLTGASGYLPDYLPIIKIYHNNRDNTFTETTPSTLTGIYNGAAEWGDYNNDGLLDILLVGDSGLDFIFKLYLNDGNQGFTEQTALKLPGGIACSSSSADYDSDGDLDILFSGYTGALSSTIYRNNLYLIAGKLKPNKRPESPVGLISEVSPRSLKLKWDGIKTDETFFVNMSYNIRCKLKDEDTWLVAPQSSAVGYRSLNDLGNAQLNRSYTIKEPVSGKYYWQVQAVDQSFSGSEWSKIDSVIIKNTQAYFSTDTVCFGLTTTFTDESVVTDGIASWLWDFKDGTTSVLQNPVHNYASAGTYAVKLLVTSTSGIKDSLTQNVIVKAKPKPSFTAPNVCIGASTQITNTSTLTGLTASKWSWSFGDGQTSEVQNPGTHNYALSGTFKAMLKAVTTNGCSDSIINDVIVAAYPETSISVAGDFETVDGKLTFCDGLNLQLTAKSDPLYTYQWRKDENDLTGAETNTYTVASNSGTYTARLINTLANCISISDPKTINIKPTPTKPAIKSDNYNTGDCLGEGPVRLSVDQPSAGYNYTWSRNEVPLENSISSSLEGYLETGNFTVTAEQSGCFAKSNVFEITSQGAPDKPLLFARGPNMWYIGCNVTSASAFKWYYNDNLIVGANENYYVADQNLGTYFLRVQNAAGCYTRSDELIIPTNNYLPSLKKSGDTDPFAGLKIYPNPSPGIFNLEMDNDLSGDVNISIISQSGREVLRIKINKSTSHFSTQIDLSGQTRGTYFVKISLDEYFTTNQIIVE